MKPNRWAAIALGALLFVCGAIFGALAMSLHHPALANAEDYRQRYVNEMQSKLKLTPAQVSQLQDILDDTKAKVKAVRDSYHPQMIKIKDEQISRVKSILTPQQVPAYVQLVAERERRAKEQEERDREADQRRVAARHANRAQ